MFYTEEQFVNKTTCSVCNETFKDPRWLPCGECICNKCINGLACPFCKTNHTAPVKGFPICKVMVSLIKEKPMGEFKCKAIDRLKSELIEIKDKMNTLNSKMHLSIESISEHCEVVRNQIDIKTESIMLEIENCKEKLIKDVDDYEMRCKETVENKKYEQQFKQIIKQNEGFLEKYTNYIKKQKIDEEEAIKMNQDAFLQKNILTNEIKNFDATIFDKKKILFEDFEKNFVSSMIGTIIYKPIRLFDFNNYNTSVNLAQIINFTAFRNIMVLENGDFVTTFNDYSNLSSIAIFDRDTKLIKTSQLKTLTGSTSSTLFTANSYKDFIILNYLTSYYYLSTLSSSFVINNSINCGKQYISVCGNSESIIGLNANTIDIYNPQLQLIRTAGQTKCLLPHFINDKNITQIEILNKRYILRTENKLRMINIDTGIEEVSIEVSNYQLIMGYKKFYVVAYNEKNEFEFQTYNLNGVLEAKYSMVAFTEDSLLLYNNRIDFLLNKSTLVLKKYC
jgi:hypothetical protein